MPFYAYTPSQYTPGLKGVISWHVEVGKCRKPASEALLLAQNLLSLMVILEARFVPRFQNIIWPIRVAEG
jgi:hypothetical protein